MINVLLIDDEKPALRVLEFLLRDNEMVKIVGMYTDPLQGIKEISNVKPEVIFLDINMPKLNGIDAASLILDADPSIEIIFVTAYDQYAVAAFEINALDYLLKPISRQRLDKTIERIIKHKGNIISKEAKSKLIIKTLGRFEVGHVGKQPIRWRSEKTKELFAYLLHHEGEKVSKEEILENVFDDLDIRKAVHMLHNGIYYIRKALLDYGVTPEEVLIEGNYRLKVGNAEVDYLAFMQYAEQCNSDALSSDYIDKLYCGDYMEFEAWVWSEPVKAKLSMQYTGLLQSLAQKLIITEEYDKAEKYLLKAYEKNPYEEEITLLLIRLYKTMNKNNSARKHYLAYADMLMNELGVMPDERVMKLIKLG